MVGQEPTLGDGWGEMAHQYCQEALMWWEQNKGSEESRESLGGSVYHWWIQTCWSFHGDGHLWWTPKPCICPLSLPPLALFLKLMEAYLRVRIKKNTIMFYCYNNYVVAVLPIATLLNESWAKCLHGRLDGTKCSLIVANRWSSDFSHNGLDA